MDFIAKQPLALSSIPDDLSIPQFIFDFDQHPTRVKFGGEKSKEAPWLIEDETGRAFYRQELRQRTEWLANGLHVKFGIKEDDVVVIFSRNHVDYPTAIWATHSLGGVISGANPDFTTPELVYQLEQTSATLLVVHPDVKSVAYEAAARVGLAKDRVLVLGRPGEGRMGDTQAKPKAEGTRSVEDVVRFGREAKRTFVERKFAKGEARKKLAFLSFSSGTTGRPKAVAIPHYALIANVIQMAVGHRLNEEYCAWEDRRYRPGDVAIGVLPFYHIYGLVLNLHMIIYAGMSVVVVSKFNYEGMLKSIMRHRISHLFLVPPHIVLLCKHPLTKKYDIQQHIRMIMCGAAPLSHELNQQVLEMLPRAHIGQAYGMTETCTCVTAWSIDKQRGVSGSSGVLLPGTIARVRKADGSLAGYDEAGELLVKIPSAALGYANNLQATKETFMDGWIRTGDEVKITKEGEVFILDRLKEIMKVKGFQVAPAELEGCILDHPDVSNACVVGVPDDYSGEVPLAFVVLSADAAKRVEADKSAVEAIKASVIQHVASAKVHYKHLAGGVEVVPSIPTSPSGKLLRRILRERAKELVANKVKGGAGLKAKAKL